MADMLGIDERAKRMQAALSPVLVSGPEFLAGRLEADDMAHTMVQAVEAYTRGEQERTHAGVPAGEGLVPTSASRTTQELEAALAEIYTCGSGYLADRCGADCVARTMTQIVGEFGGLASTGRS